MTDATEVEFPSVLSIVTGGRGAGAGCDGAGRGESPALVGIINWQSEIQNRQCCGDGFFYSPFTIHH